MSPSPYLRQLLHRIQTNLSLIESSKRQLVAARTQEEKALWSKVNHLQWKMLRKETNKLAAYNALRRALQQAAALPPSEL